jgi:L-alanine-DL-glutamate epimerase-like enolase superfamily enzyme
LDANEGYTAKQAIEVLDRLNGLYLFKFDIITVKACSFNLSLVCSAFFSNFNFSCCCFDSVFVVTVLSEMGVTPVLFEQPVHRDDWEGLCDVSVAAMERYRVSVAADESCRSLLDAQKIIHGNLAHVINIKLAKMGVLGALEVIDAARKAGIALMIGGMVETRIAMGFAGHLAAGLGCFRLVHCEIFSAKRGYW